MWQDNNFVLGGETVQPGERKVIHLPVANLYIHSEMCLPVHVLRGKKPGPTLLISAAVHGDELNGVEIIRRLLLSKRLQRLKGTLIAIPYVNGFGLLQHSRYLPDRRDLNRSFPGSERGPLASRLANIFLEGIVRHCDYGIDLHTGAVHRSNLPQVRANLDDEATLALAEAFGVPVMLNANVRDGSLRHAAAEYGVTMLLYEGGEALRLDELSIKAGMRGIMNVMEHLAMVGKRRKNASTDKPAITVTPSEPFRAGSSSWLRAPESGLFNSRVRLGDLVRKGDVLGNILDPADMLRQQAYDIECSITGIVIGKTNLPLVSAGDALIHIARFEDVVDVAAEMDVFHQQYE